MPHPFSQALIIAIIILSLTSCATPEGIQEEADGAQDIRDALPPDHPSAASLGAIPDRPPTALSGSEFIRKAAHMSKQAREDAILRELRRGNIPEFLRQLQPVHVKLKRRDQLIYQGTLWVMPDYLAIGHDDDYIRIPMNPITAQQVADHYGFLLPTKKLVDDIYRQAKVRLSPQPLQPGPMMTSNDYYAKHQRLISQQLEGMEPGLLTAGHKKDIVLSNRLREKPRRVAIYGWHHANGTPIQPLSIVHNDIYADYSHGIRLIANMMAINGQLYPVSEVLQHPTLNRLVSDEGMIKPRIAIDCLW